LPRSKINTLSLHDALPIYDKDIEQHDMFEANTIKHHQQEIGSDRQGEQDACASISRKNIDLPGDGDEKKERSQGPAHQYQHTHRSEEHTSELQSPYDLVCR